MRCIRFISAVSALWLGLSGGIATAQATDTFFRPGEIWNDTAGGAINAPGGGILLYDGTYYWYGAHKVAGEVGNRAQVGVPVYASTPFGPWTDLGNPVRGTPADVATTFGAQSAFVLPAPGHPGQFLLMADRWNPQNAIDERYVWLPIVWEGDRPTVRWVAQWRLQVCPKGNPYA